MSYIGKWTVESVGMVNDKDEYVRLSPEEYLKSPMPYVDETDEEAVADELKERKSMIGIILRVDEDGKMHALVPIPEGVTQEEIDEAVKSGEITVVDGMLSQDAMDWEERNGEMWFKAGIEGETFGEPVDPWVKASDEEGFLNFMTFRFKKAE